MSTIREIKHKIVCAIDTGHLDDALGIVRRLHPFCGAFKIGHGLTLPHGLSVIARLRDAGAERIFLDLKFHDIPNSVAVAVREASRYGVWMTTLHLHGGPAMLTAAVEEARAAEAAPLLVGVSVLTSLDESTLTRDLGCARTLPDQMRELTRMGMDCGLDGAVCSVHEAADLRRVMGHGILVTPGIRAGGGSIDDHARAGDGQAALEASADYLVIGRALSGSDDPEAALRSLRLID